ncbi:toxin-antitoxin system YwqK family antitoxin [Pseudomonas sp. XS1P51]
MSSLSLSGCFTEEVDTRQTHEIQGLLYKIHEKEPFTGRILNYPMSVMGLFSVGTCSVEIKKGLPDGDMRCSDNAGTLVALAQFEGGKREGREEKYDPKTTKMTSRGHWSKGQLDGVQELFNAETGDLIGETHYIAGKKVGTEKLWDASGKTLITSLDWQNGLQSGFDNRGEHRSNRLNGKEHGLQQSFSVHSNKYYLSSENNYVNGTLDGAQKEFDFQGNVLEESVFSNGVRQSHTQNKYEDGRLVHHVSQIETKNNTNIYDLDTLANQGTEQYWDAKTGDLVRVLEWNRGKLVSATRTVWLNGKVESQYQGIGKDGYRTNQSVEKTGIERVFDQQGELMAHLQWADGKLIGAIVQLPKTQRPDHPGKMGVMDLRMNSYYSSPLEGDPDFYKDSLYDEYSNFQFQAFIDPPSANQAAMPTVTSMATGKKSQADIDACVQKQVDAVHAEDEEALIRADMLEEFEQGCS